MNNMLRVAIVGSRTFNNFKKFSDTILNTFIYFNTDQPKEIMVVSGGARGVDTLAKRFAKELFECNYKEFLPDWDKYGKKAGYIRNVDIIKNSDVVIAFWDGCSKGTRHSLSIAKEMKKTTFIFYV